jgi:hypothetical protein
MPNRFSIVPKPGNQILPWEVHQSRPDNYPLDCDYFGKIFAMVDKQLDGWNLDFVMTWSLDEAPIQGKNVVIFLIGDEMSQSPAYANQVKAIFKTGGVKPFCTVNLDSLIYSSLEILRETRNLLKRHQRRWRNQQHNTGVRSMIFPIPLGYHAQVGVPMVPMATRKWDVFFAGHSLKPQWNKPRSWLLSPRAYSRNQLGREVVRLQENNRALACNFVAGNSRRLSPMEYSAQLADSKICLVPRGNFHETFRFLEAARAGCILISEPMPDLWYYQGNPAVIVKSWNRLDQVLDSILNFPDRMMKLHNDSIAWWRNRACEKAVADYVVNSIKSLDEQKLDKVSNSSL